MELRQLEYFLAVADELSFTRAARRLFAAQSTVSAGIRALERELGAPLFTRAPTGVRTTPFADRILSHAKAALAASKLMAGRAEAEVGLTGELKFCLFPAFATITVAELISEFVRSHPRLDIWHGQLDGGPEEMLAELHRGTLDLAVAPLWDPPEGLTAEVLFESTFAAMVPADHPFAQRESISLHELANHRWVDLDSRFTTRRLLDQAFRERAIDRRIGNKVSNPAEIPALVAATSSVAALGAVTASSFATPAVAIVPLTETIPWTLWAIMTRTPTLAARAFLDDSLKPFIKRLGLEQDGQASNSSLI